MKELVCTLCNYLMSNATSEDEFLKNENEIINTSNDHPPKDQEFYQRHNDKDYIKSCKVGYSVWGGRIKIYKPML